jgi:RNA polymerase sigma factor (sigma-70 family)
MTPEHPARAEPLLEAVPDELGDRLRLYLAGDRAVHQHVLEVARRAIHYRLSNASAVEREDLCSEAVCGVWARASAPGFRLKHGLDAFVRFVAVARCIDWLRTRRRQVEIDERLPDPRPGPEADACVGDRAEFLARAAAGLPESMRTLLQERLIEGVPFEALARRHATPSGTLRSRFNEAIVRLRKRLGKLEDAL